MRLSFPHPLLWYEVGMLKVPAVIYELEYTVISETKHVYIYIYILVNYETCFDQLTVDRMSLAVHCQLNTQARPFVPTVMAPKRRGACK